MLQRSNFMTKTRNAIFDFDTGGNSIFGHLASSRRPDERYLARVVNFASDNAGVSRTATCARPLCRVSGYSHRKEEDDDLT